MKQSRMIELLTADLQANGDSDNITLGIIVQGPNGSRHRLDCILFEEKDSISRDWNYPNGMVCIVGERTNIRLDVAELEAQGTSQEIAMDDPTNR